MNSLSKTTRKAIKGSLILLIATMLFIILSQAIIVANAQGDEAVVIIQPSIGGTTDPASGTTTYANGTNFVLTATPDAGYTFQYWAISGNYTPGHITQQPTIIIDPDTGEIIGQVPRVGSTDIDSLTTTVNPLNVSHGYGYTYVYQAVFAPTTEPTPSPINGTISNDTAIVIMEPSIGGTTNPSAGTYAYANGTNFVLTATPDAGYTFQYWIVNGNVTPGHITTGKVSVIYDENGNIIAEIPRQSTEPGTIDSLTFTANPANVSHGYGYTYSYSAVFAPIPVATPSPSTTVAPTASPTAAPTASPTPTPASSSGFPTIYVVAIVVVIIIIIVTFAAVMMRRKK